MTQTLNEWRLKFCYDHALSENAELDLADKFDEIEKELESLTDAVKMHSDLRVENFVMFAKEASRAMKRIHELSQKVDTCPNCSYPFTAVSPRATCENMDGGDRNCCCPLCSCDSSCVVCGQTPCNYMHVNESYCSPSCMAARSGN